jgi:hypothetical protein
MYRTEQTEPINHPDPRVVSYQWMLRGLVKRWREEDAAAKYRAEQPERERQAADALRDEARKTLNKLVVRLRFLRKVRGSGASHQVRSLLTALVAGLNANRKSALLEAWAQLPATQKRWQPREIETIKRDVCEGRYAGR